MKLLNTTQVAERLGLSVQRVRQLIDEGTLKAQQLGREYAIEESALEKVRVYGKPGRPRKEEPAPKVKAKRKASAGSKS